MLAEGGYLADPLSLAQRLMEKLQVNLHEDYGLSSSPSDMYLYISLHTNIFQARTLFATGPALP